MTMGELKPKWSGPLNLFFFFSKYSKHMFPFLPDLIPSCPVVDLEISGGDILTEFDITTWDECGT